MHARTLPPIAIHFLILLISLTQNLSGKSVKESVKFFLADSTLNQLETWQEQDSLLPWVLCLKGESQKLRSTDDISGSIALLTKCIDEAWRAPSTEGEGIQTGWIYINRAYLYDQKYGDYLAAKRDYLSGLKSFEQFDYNDYFVARYLLQPLGNIYTRLGENEQAIGMLHEFQQICRNENQLEALMNSYNDLGRAYMNKNDYLKAIELFDIGSQIEPSDFYNLGLIESSKAEAQFYLNQFDEGILTAKSALIHLEEAIKKMNPSDYQFEACGRYTSGVHTILGKLYSKKNDFDLSFIQFQKAWDKSSLFYSGKHRRKSKILNGLGDCYQQSRLFNKSLDAYQKALTESVIGFNNHDILINPKDDLLIADVAIGESLIGKARVAFLFFNESKNTDWLQLSVDTYKTYFRWVKKLRVEQLNIESKLKLTSEIHTIGEEALNAIFQLKEYTKDESLSKLAFQIMEQTKGMVLSESLISTLMSSDSSLIKECLLELDQLKMQKNLFQINLNTAEESEINRIKSRIDEIDRAIQLKNFQLRENYPSYDKIRISQNDSLDFEKLTHYLTNKKTDLFTYFLGDDHLFVVGATNKGFTFNQLNIHHYLEITPLFLEQLNSPQQANSDTYATLANQLFQILFEKQSTINSNLLILPDGSLNLIPFEALVKSNRSESNSYKSLDYLVLNHTIHYAPSIKFILKEWTNKPSEKTYLGVAPIFKNSSQFSFLPQSEKEVGYAKDLFNGELLLNEEATKEQFIENANNYEIIHLSTHAGLGTRKNNDGWIAFSSNKNSDKMLTPELLQLDLSARLVVLNGCETGLGEIFKGEGILSMARGFIQAGAQNTITNLWQVNHASNAKIMQSFYQTLQINNSPSSSLRQAKIDYINDQEVDDLSAHPFYWSASILIGTNNNISIKNKDDSSMNLIVLLSIVGFFILILALYIKYK